MTKPMWFIVEVWQEPLKEPFQALKVRRIFVKTDILNDAQEYS